MWNDSFFGVLGLVGVEIGLRMYLDVVIVILFMFFFFVVVGFVVCCFCLVGVWLCCV